MKVIKNLIKISQDVVDKKITLQEHVQSIIPTYELYEIFHDKIMDESLLGIYRRVIDSNTMAIMFVVSDDSAEEFKTWFDLYQNSQTNAIGTLFLTPTTELITNMTDSEIIEDFKSPSDFSSTAFNFVLL